MSLERKVSLLVLVKLLVSKNLISDKEAKGVLSLSNLAKLLVDKNIVSSDNLDEVGSHYDTVIKLMGKYVSSDEKERIEILSELRRILLKPKRISIKP